MCAEIVQPQGGELAEKQEASRDDKGRWIKGNSGNWSGGKKRHWAYELEEALGIAATERGKTLVQHAVERAYTSDMVLRVILNKILPDLSHIAGDVEVRQKILQVIGMLPIEPLAAINEKE